MKNEMLFACYLALVAVSCLLAAKRAPIADEPAFASAGLNAPCEVIELFTPVAEQSASRAA